jgi:uncharacterized protein (TIGR02118 family)
MLKRLSFLVKRDDMTVEEFRRYWLGPHASIIKSMPNVVHYSVTVFAASGAIVTAPDGLAIDGFAALVFASEADMAAAYASPAGVAAAADIPNFARSVSRVVVDETIFVHPPPTEHG